MWSRRTETILLDSGLKRIEYKTVWVTPKPSPLTEPEYDSRLVDYDDSLRSRYSTFKAATKVTRRSDPSSQASGDKILYQSRRLKELRIALGLSQMAVAVLVNYKSYSAVTECERANPRRARLLERCLRALEQYAKNYNPSVLESLDSNVSS